MENNLNSKSIKKFAKKMRLEILNASLKCGEPSHIGGALSIVDIIATLYKNTMNLDLKNPKDRFILSKGHGFLGLLSAIYCKNYIKKSEFLKFQTNGSEFIAHPIMNTNIGIESSNGSLGQGLSLGVGMALAYKKMKKKNKIYVLVGDGECYEGSIWESAITATEQELNNLTVIVDSNGFQNDGAIHQIMGHKKLQQKWRGFNWNTITCNGHNVNELIHKLKFKHKKMPTVLIARTIKGKGIKFMENNNDWHHGRVTKKIYYEAIKSLNNNE